MAAIAALKRIQPSTVQGYLAEAVLFGHAYRWQSFGVSDPVLAAVEEAAAAVLCSAPACTSAAAVAIQPQHLAPAPGEFLSTAAAPESMAGPVPGPAAAQKAVAPAAAVQSHARDCAPWATGVFADDDSDSDGDRTVAACMQAAAATVKSEPATAGCSACVSSPAAHVAAQCPRSSAATMARDRVAFQAAAKFEATTGFLMIDLAARLSAAGVTMRTFRHGFISCGASILRRLCRAASFLSPTHLPDGAGVFPDRRTTVVNLLQGAFGGRCGSWADSTGPGASRPHRRTISCGRRRGDTATCTGEPRLFYSASLGLRRPLPDGACWDIKLQRKCPGAMGTPAVTNAMTSSTQGLPHRMKWTRPKAGQRF